MNYTHTIMATDGSRTKHGSNQCFISVPSVFHRCSIGGFRPAPRHLRNIHNFGGNQRYGRKRLRKACVDKSLRR